MTEPLVVLTGAGKRYRQHIDATPLGGGPRRRQHDRDLWALRDVNLELEAGESLGVLGRNGAGKSTLLAMLAGVTAPSEGTVTVRGRIAPLLSVGVGFHQEMTGRENVYINARMLGLGRSAIASKFDGIVDFAGLGSFLDTPVKYYSSGMYARLGFAIASSVEPDLLIIDEVLSVGDYDFQNRSFERMNDLRHSGVAVVLVSHNALALQAFCQRGLVLASGRATYEGSIDQAVTAYGDAIVQGDGDGPQIALTVSRADGSSAAHLEGGDTLRATVALDITGLQNPGLDVVVRKDDLIIHRRRKALEVPSGATNVTVAASLRLPLVTGTYAVTVGSGELQSPSPFPEGARQLVRVNSHREVHGTLDLQARLILT